MKTLFCIGELLIDWISTDIDSSLVDSVNFIKKAGGAPGNAAISCNRLGGKSAFAGKVGNDAFGMFLKEILVKEDIDTENLIFSEHPTTFAYVSIKKDGERDFIFMRGADELLEFHEIKLPQENAVFHFGSATGFLGGDLSETYFKALDYALEKNFFISFDPNFREALWPNPEKFIEFSKDFISKSDLIKLSEEEALLISGKKDLQEAITTFKLKKNAIMCVTLGKNGTLLYFQEKLEIVPSISVEAIDTTGAGDAFIGAVLKQVCDKTPESYNEIKNYVSFANKVAAISTTKLGAIEALPTLEQILKY